MKCPSCLQDTAIEADGYYECESCGYCFSLGSHFAPGLADHGIKGFDYVDHFHLRRAIIDHFGEEQWTASKSEPNFLHHLKTRIEDNRDLFYKFCKIDFWLFDSWVFAPAVEEVYGKYITGDYNIFMVDFLQSFRRTMEVAPRRHSKSMKGYSWLAWKMWWLYSENRKYFPTVIFSYIPSLAGDHVENFKRFVAESENIRALGFKDSDPTAKYNGTYTTKNKEFTIKHFGMKGAKRGTNCNAAMLDDVYTDPDHPDDPRIVRTVNKQLKSQIIPLIQGPHHIRGTALSESDLWFSQDEAMVYGDAIQIIKAINELKIEDKIVEYALWPNHPDYDIYGLKDLQRATVYTDPGTGKIYMFDQEFQGVPMTSTDSKWGMDIINKSIDPDLVWYRYDRDHRTWGLRCDYASMFNVATWDPGKGVHPAQFCVFNIQGGVWRQIASEWFDHMPYARARGDDSLTQTEIINASRNFFGWDKLYGDNTNQVLEFAHERGEIPGLVPIRISSPVRNGFLTEITKFLGTDGLKLLPDERQAKQLHQIRNDGSCPTSYGPNGGHGEPLTTLGLALTGHLIEDPGDQKRVRVIQRGTRMSAQDRAAATMGGRDVRTEQRARF